MRSPLPRPRVCGRLQGRVSGDPPGTSRERATAAGIAGCKRLRERACPAAFGVLPPIVRGSCTAAASPDARSTREAWRPLAYPAQLQRTKRSVMPATKKIDFKREFRDLYAAGREPSLVEVPTLAFLMVDGHGDPNTAAEYRDAVEALYAVAYAAKFAVKRAPDGIDFGVMPLEGLWRVPDTSRFTIENKSDWSWTAMIMQPEPVTAEIVHTTMINRSLAGVVHHARPPSTCARAGCADSNRQAHALPSAWALATGRIRTPVISATCAIQASRRTLRSGLAIVTDYRYRERASAHTACSRRPLRTSGSSTPRAVPAYASECGSRRSCCSPRAGRPRQASRRRRQRRSHPVAKAAVSGRSVPCGHPANRAAMCEGLPRRGSPSQSFRQIAWTRT
jgi:hypothetical protein